MRAGCRSTDPCARPCCIAISIRPIRSIRCKFHVREGWDTIGSREGWEQALVCAATAGFKALPLPHYQTHPLDKPREATMAEVKRGLLEEESIKSIGTEERKVIFASSLGTVFEWYDFYLYATLAPFFAALFFPSGNDTAALLSAFAT